MKIRTKLYLTSSISIAFIIGLIFLIYFTTNDVAKQNGQRSASRQTLQAVSELDILTYDYLLNHEKRAKDQWQLKYASLEKNLETLHKSMDEDEQKIISRMPDNFDLIGATFAELISNHDKGRKLAADKAAQKEIDLNAKSGDRLMAQLLVVSQSMISDASILAEKNVSQLLNAQNMARNLLLFAGLILLVYSLLTTLILFRHIAKSFDVLRRGARRIGKGNLDSKISIDSQDELGEISQAFNQMAADLKKVVALKARLESDIMIQKQAEEEKNNFIAVMSHELRNPLTPILAASQLMRAQMDRSSAQGLEIDRFAEESVDIIEQQAKNMSRLLDDLLDISRISRGKIILKKIPIDLSVCLKRAMQAVKPLMDRQKHEFSALLPDQPVYLEADPVRLEQITINLLNNSAKYSKPGSKIRLEAGLNGDRAEIKVIDNGIGLDIEKIDSIFSLYSRTTPAYTSTQGEMGIGLKLAKDLVSLHNGTIAAKSEGPGLGSEFTVSLPALPSGYEEKPAVEAPATPAKSRLRVLIVEDNARIAELFSSIIQFAGHDSKVRYDGESALALANDYLPHAAFIDIGLPGMSGYEIARELRKRENGSGSKMKLVAITGYGQEEDRRQSQEAGFDLHIVKPVELAVLETLLADINNEFSGNF